MEEFKRAYHRAKEALYSLNSDKVEVYERVIGPEWESFGGIPGDQAFRVNINNDPEIYNLIYETDPNSPEGHVTSFPKHSHKQRETAMVLKGKIKIELSDRECIVEAGNCYSIDPNRSHVVTFYGHTIISLLFHPAFQDGQWKGIIHKD